MNKNILFLILIILGFSGCSKELGDDLYYDAGGKSGESSGGGGNSGSGNQPGVITAGEWKDLAHWDFWQEILLRDDLDSMSHYWSYFTDNRIEVELKNQQGEPVIDAVVKLQKEGKTVFTAKTDNQGKAELWPDLFEQNIQPDLSQYTLNINNGAATISQVKTIDQGVNQTIVSSGPPSGNIEIAFVVDATGSMGDELEYLKVELVDVLSRVKSANPEALIRTSSVFYRDKGDEYVTRISKFTQNTSTTIGFIKDQEAGGGGDFPEAVHSALEAAITQLSWSSTARTRLLFLVLDAPPHYQQDVIEDIHAYNKMAAEKGIKIIPVTASGIDKQTEFLMRFMSVSTNSTYVFITNHSGIGNDHLEPTIGEYEVEFLNDLMVRLINHFAE
ncbi:MAG TPA: VWA domain-containing protein [Saprospiraceae bacterium]|nr:hypothetical protein [Saprospirales bacterium]HRQ30460.1 VWA domain-containing protein [Saprospiraceae bacterium]